MQIIKRVKFVYVSFIFFCVLIGLAFAADTDSLVVTETGNVGIGTTTPGAKLEINGNATIGAVANTGTTIPLRINGLAVSDGATPYGNYAGILFDANSGYTISARRYLITNALGINKFGIIRSVDATTDPALGAAGAITSGTADFVIDNTGNVGIGTTNPNTKLDVNGSIKANNHLTHLPWYNLGTAPQGPWVPGHIKLITPIQHKESNMFAIKIKGYRYGLGGVPVEIQCGGYAYGAVGLIQTGCNTEGTSDPVGIGVENNHVIITIGSGTNIWYYDHFTAEYSGWNAKSPQDFKWEFVYNQPPNTSNTNNVIVNDAAGTIMASSYNSPSDVRWKENIEPISNALQRVSRLKGVNFQWANKARSGIPQVGVIAQEVEEIFPEVVSTDSEGYKSVAYSKLVPPLIEAVKDLKAENEDLRSKLEALSARIDSIANK